MGIQLDSKLSFTAHAKKAAEKANAAVQKLARILPNVSAAKQGKRTLMSNVVYSLLLYGTPVWSGRMSCKGINEMIKVQRRIILRVACAYRTTSTDALQVVASIPPLDLQAKRRKSYHDSRGDPEFKPGPQIEESLVRSWQERWDLSPKGRWTQRLIPNIQRWYKRSHGSVDYWVTQMLTGHGFFAAYLCKYGKLRSAECWFCGHHEDDAEHTLFKCHAWEVGRRRVSARMGVELTPENMVTSMLDSRESREAVADLIHQTMRAKEDEERSRENLANAVNKLSCIIR